MFLSSSKRSEGEDRDLTYKSVWSGFRLKGPRSSVCGRGSSGLEVLVRAASGGCVQPARALGRVPNEVPYREEPFSLCGGADGAGEFPLFVHVPLSLSESALVLQVPMVSLRCQDLAADASVFVVL